MPKFQAPERVSGIGLPSGRNFLADADGIVTAPDDLTEFDIAEFIKAGFVPIPAADPSPPATPGRKATAASAVDQAAS